MNSNRVNSRSGLQRLSEHSQIKQAAHQSTQVSGMQPHTQDRTNKSKEPLVISNKIESCQMSTSMSELLIDVASFANAFWNQTSRQSTPTSMYICSSTACADRIGMHVGFRTLSDSQTPHSNAIATKSEGWVSYLRAVWIVHAHQLVSNFFTKAVLYMSRVVPGSIQSARLLRYWVRFELLLTTCPDTQ